MVVIRFLGNACIEIIGKRDHIVIDPVFLSHPKKGIEKVFITHHHSDHITREKLNELRRDYVLTGKELEIFVPYCVYDELKIDFTVIQPTSKINLNNGLVRVLENKCWKAEGCVAYLIEIDNKKILHTADSAEFSIELKSLNDEIDLCFVACFENNFSDYLKFLKMISQQMAIPYHFTQEKQGEAIRLAEFLLINGINSTFLSIGEEIELK
ncbi:hypothetical protein LCGC14_1731250 [marine sediment metagenome]|uniref:Metallo-beta-lactamase domain-containing protein n=1 Tax=marine sediment metagenome TaxID=412755 RepID=A0A0F9K971_9ZZZZ